MYSNLFFVLSEQTKESGVEMRRNKASHLKGLSSKDPVWASFPKRVWAKDSKEDMRHEAESQGSKGLYHLVDPNMPAWVHF